MVKNLPSKARDTGLIPGWGTKILQAMQYATLFVSEVIMALPLFLTKEPQIVIAGLTSLLMIGTFGLMITFKYIDKASRGRD